MLTLCVSPGTCICVDFHIVCMIPITRVSVSHVSLSADTKTGLSVQTRACVTSSNPILSGFQPLPEASDSHLSLCNRLLDPSTSVCVCAV